jgi:hypothetical protein
VVPSGLTLFTTQSENIFFAEMPNFAQAEKVSQSALG